MTAALAPAATTSLTPLPWQEKALALRTHLDLIVLAGGRGGGKTHCAILALLAHCVALGPHAAPLVVREAWAPLGEFLTKIEGIAAIAFGTRGLSYNRAEGVIRLPTGGNIFGASMHEGESSYVRWQGRNLTGIWGEEIGNLSAQHFAFLRRLESNLRPPLGFPVERWWTANPGGKASPLIYRNWISKTPPWRAARDHSGLSYVWIPSVYTDKLHIDGGMYRRNLLASVGSDEALAKAWLDGRWDSLGGLMFPVNPAAHIIRPLPDWMVRRMGKITVGSDWGNGAPATALVAMQCREPINWDGRRIPYGSVIVLEETDTAIDEADLSVGSGLDARSFAEQVRDVAARHGNPRPRVVVDDAKGLQGDSVVSYYRSVGLNASIPNKRSRTEGWDIIRQHLQEAEKEQGRPGLYFTTRCPHTIQTLSEAPRGTLNPRDLDPKWNADHWADALSYLMKEIAGGPRSGQGTVVGAW